MDQKSSKPTRKRRRGQSVPPPFPCKKYCNTSGNEHRDNTTLINHIFTKHTGVMRVLRRITNRSSSVPIPICALLGGKEKHNGSDGNSSWVYKGWMKKCYEHLQHPAGLNEEALDKEEYLKGLAMFAALLPGVLLSEEWTCSQCSFENEATDSKCQDCENDRVEAPSSSNSSMISLKERIKDLKYFWDKVKEFSLSVRQQPDQQPDQKRHKGATGAQQGQGAAGSTEPQGAKVATGAQGGQGGTPQGAQGTQLQSQSITPSGSIRVLFRIGRHPFKINLENLISGINQSFSSTKRPGHQHQEAKFGSISSHSDYVRGGDDRLPKNHVLKSLERHSTDGAVCAIRIEGISYSEYTNNHDTMFRVWFALKVSVQALMPESGKLAVGADWTEWREYFEILDIMPGSVILLVYLSPAVGHDDNVCKELQAALSEALGQQQVCVSWWDLEKEIIKDMRMKSPVAPFPNPVARRFVQNTGWALSLFYDKSERTKLCKSISESLGVRDVSIMKFHALVPMCVKWMEESPLLEPLKASLPKGMHGGPLQIIVDYWMFKMEFDEECARCSTLDKSAVVSCRLSIKSVSEKWICRKCSLSNEATASRCDGCRTERVSQEGAPPIRDHPRWGAIGAPPRLLTGSGLSGSAKSERRDFHIATRSTPSGVIPMKSGLGRPRRTGLPSRPFMSSRVPLSRSLAVRSRGTKSLSTLPKPANKRPRSQPSASRSGKGQARSSGKAEADIQMKLARKKKNSKMVNEFRVEVTSSVPPQPDQQPNQQSNQKRIQPQSITPSGSIKVLFRIGCDPFKINPKNLISGINQSFSSTKIPGHQHLEAKFRSISTHSDYVRGCGRLPNDHVLESLSQHSMVGAVCAIRIEGISLSEYNINIMSIRTHVESALKEYVQAVIPESKKLALDADLKEWRNYFEMLMVMPDSTEVLSTRSSRKTQKDIPRKRGGKSKKDPESQEPPLKKQKQKPRNTRTAGSFFKNT